LRVVLQRKNPEGEVGRKTTELGRIFGIGVIEQQTGARHPGSCSGHAAALGIPSCVAEIGGGYLSRVAEDKAVALGVRGVQNIMKHLGMIAGDPEMPARQLVVDKRSAVRPQSGGYLLAEIEAEDILGEAPGVQVQAGQHLGTIFDPYSFETLEELTSPVDGVVYVVRRTGLCEAGDRGMGIGNLDGAEWV
jgi:predicted deacylase